MIDWLIDWLIEKAVLLMVKFQCLSDPECKGEKDDCWWEKGLKCPLHAAHSRLVGQGK